MNQWLVAAGVAAVLSLGVGSLAAQDNAAGPGGRQGRGNFDPEQMRARMMERYREQLEVKNDDEWKLIQTRIEKVTEARRQVGFGGGMGMFGRGMRPPGGEANAPQGGDQGRRGGRGGEVSPEAEALQKAIDAKASNAELKTAVEKYVAARKQRQANLEAAQAELRKVLSVRQEAIATMAGLL
jgi:hypothetical protein